MKKFHVWRVLCWAEASLVEWMYRTLYGFKKTYRYMTVFEFWFKNMFIVCVYVIENLGLELIGFKEAGSETLC